MAGAEASGVIEDTPGDVWSFGRVVQDMLEVSAEPADVTAAYRRADGALQDLVSECLAPRTAARPVGFSVINEALAEIAAQFLEIGDLPFADSIRHGMRLREWQPVLQHLTLGLSGQAEALRGFGLPEEALSLLQDGAGAVNSPSAMYTRARALVDVGDYVEARAELMTLLARLDEPPGGIFEDLRERAWNELGVVYRRMRRWELAKRALVMAAKSAKEWDQFAQALINLAATQQDAGEPEEAMRTFRDLIRRAPRDPVVLKQFAVFLRDRDDLDGARSVLQRAALIEPANRGIHLLLAELLCELRSWSAAVLECEMALRTGATWIEIGPLVTLIGDQDPALSTSGLHRALSAATTEDERRSFAEQARQWAGFLEARNRKLAEQDTGFVVAAGGLWLPPSAARPPAPAPVREAPPTWPDLDSAKRWFGTLDSASAELSARQAADLLAFAAYASQEGDLSTALEAVRLLDTTELVDPRDAVPYRLLARVLASVALFQHGHLDRSWKQATSASDIAERLDGPERDRQMDSAYGVALQAGEGAPDGESVLDVLERQVRLRIAVLGEDSPDTLRARHNRAILLDRLNRSADGAAEMLEVVKGRRAVLGYDSAETFNSTLMLSGIVGRAGDWQRAAKLAWHAVGETVVMFDNTDPRRFLAVAEWAEAKARCGDVEDALEVLRDARGTTDQVHGDSDIPAAITAILDRALERVLAIQDGRECPP